MKYFKYSKYLLWLLALLPLLILRDFTPSNELRYLSIADEAIRNGHIFTFYHQGIAYADKPPVYLWIVMLNRLLWGAHNMFWLSLFSVLPAFVIIGTMDKWVAPYLSRKDRTTGQLLLLTTAFFLGSMIVLRMDILMSMFIVLALHSFYKIYSNTENAFDKWLFPIYIFLAVFTKGPYGLLIPVISVIGFLLIKKQSRDIFRYLGWRTWGMLFILFLLWFGAVYAEGGKDYLHNLLFNQTVNRAINSFSHKRSVFFYLITIWYAMAPWSLLYAAVLFVAIRYKLIKSDLEKFFITTFTVSFVLLSFISAKLEGYLLPVYPFFVYFIVLQLSKLHEKSQLRMFVAIPAILFIIVPPAVILGNHYMLLPNWLHTTPVYLAAGIMGISGFLSLGFLYKRKNIYNGIHTIAYGLLCSIFIGAFILPKLNPEIGYGNLAKQAKAISEEREITSFCSYRISRAVGMDVYLGNQVEEIPKDKYKEVLMEKGAVILLLRNKDLAADGVLRELIAGKERYPSGKYCIVVWNP